MIDITILKAMVLHPISSVTVHVVPMSHKIATVITWNCLGDGPQERLRREDVGRPDQNSARGVLLLKLVNMPAMQKPSKLTIRPSKLAI